MHHLKSVLLFLGYLVCLSLADYELVAKSPRLLGCQLPGRYAATTAECGTRMVHRTGWRPADRLLHEGEEALLYYRLLLRPAATAAARPLFQVTHEG
jgi:hypothetical protein